MPKPDMVNLPEVCRMCRVSESVIRRLWVIDEFPSPVKLGSKLLWRREDVMARLGYETETENETAEV